MEDYLVKVSALPKLAHRFNTIPIKSSEGFFLKDVDNLILKFICKDKGTKTFLKKEMYFLI